jgi:hypothetical protein
MSTPASSAVAPVPIDHDSALIGPLRRRRGLIAVTALAIGLSIPVTGAGSAIASPHPPSLTSAVAATSTLTPTVAMGKLDV